jgi:hypothetical protein
MTMETIAQKPQGVSTYDFETGATTYDLSQMTAGQRWRCAISQATEAARRRFPHSTDRIERAYELVHAAKVVLHPREKTATVRSSDGTRAYTVNGVCECPDATRAPEAYCKHRLAVSILREALETMKVFGTASGLITLAPKRLATDEETPVTTPEPAQDPEIPAMPPVTTAVRHLDMTTWPTDAMPEQATPVLAAEVIPSTPRIPREFLYEIRGHTAILWGGLLHMAHAAGMHSMQVDVVTVTPEYAVMRATARFNDGGEWSDIGDASPTNVGKQIAPHFIRMASTRAMARCLRTALNIPYVASCELSDD